MTTERRKNERNMHFFKRPLTRLDTYYVLVLDKNAMVMCWDDGLRWRARIQGPALNGTIVSATGKTPRAALWKLERRSVTAAKALVKTFALVMREITPFVRKLTLVK
jgi:hypothetical protein